MTTKLLESNAMIVNLNIQSWQATKHDPVLSADLIEEYGAESNSARVNKKLINRESLKEIREAVGDARKLHNTLTLPWGRHGDRLLPVGMHQTYIEKIDSCIERLDQARHRFLADYEDLIVDAKSMLGKMFNADDYPSKEIVSRRFGIDYEINPVPSANHFLVDLADEEAEKIRADIEKRMNTKLDNAVVQLYERIETTLKRLIERLGTDENGKPRRIHASALVTMREIANAMPSMNLVNDSRLNEISKHILEILEDVEVETLRHKSKIPWKAQLVDTRRQKLSRELSTIASAYFGHTPTTP